MSPREVIARAIASERSGKVLCKIERDWPEFAATADAVIDALEKMEVTDLMHARVEWWMASDETVTELWQAMVGALRDE